MKKILVLFVCALAGVVTGFAGEEEVTVKVSAEGPNNTKFRKECEVAGKKAAIKKYLCEMDATMPEKLVDGAMSSYAKFIDGVETDEADYEGGELTCSYSVTVRSPEIRQWLAEQGYVPGAGFEIFVMEEPPDAGQIQLGDKMGSFFLNRYGKFQRTIRDLLVADAGKYGIKVILLEDNENYEEFKRVDPVLVGVSYDVNADTRGFLVTEGFLRKVQENNPDAIVMYYRVDGLTYNPQTRKMRMSLALNLKNLADNSTKSLGSIEGYEMLSSGIQQDEIMIDFGKLVKAAMRELLENKGAGKNIALIVKSMKNAAPRPEGPMKLVINCSQVDKKIKIRVRNGIKKMLVSSGLTAETKIVKDSLSCVVPRTDEWKDLDDVWCKVSEILPDLLGDDIDITDDWAAKNGDTLTVTIGK